MFTDRRLILVDKQGLTSRNVDYLVLPYRAITAYSIETAGTLDMDSELKIWVPGRTDPIQKTLKRGANVLPLEWSSPPETFGYQPPLQYPPNR